MFEYVNYVKERLSASAVWPDMLGLKIDPSLVVMVSRGGITVQNWKRTRVLCFLQSGDVHKLVSDFTAASADPPTESSSCTWTNSFKLRAPNLIRPNL